MILQIFHCTAFICVKRSTHFWFFSPFEALLLYRIKINYNFHCLADQRQWFRPASYQHCECEFVLAFDGHIYFVEICRTATLLTQQQCKKHTPNELRFLTNESNDFIHSANYFDRFVDQMFCWTSDELWRRRLHTFDWWILNSCASTAKPYSSTFIKLSRYRSKYATLLLLIICHSFVLFCTL